MLAVVQEVDLRQHNWSDTPTRTQEERQGRELVIRQATRAAVLLSLLIALISPPEAAVGRRLGEGPTKKDLLVRVSAHFWWYTPRKDGPASPYALGRVHVRTSYKYGLDLDADRQLVEVRRASTDQLIGYMPVGYEEDEIDSDRDGLISVTELQTAIRMLDEQVDGTKELPASVRARFLSAIGSARDDLKNAKVGQAYEELVKAEADLGEAVSELKLDREADKRAMQMKREAIAVVSGAIAIVLAAFGLLAFALARKGKAGRPPLV